MVSSRRSTTRSTSLALLLFVGLTAIFCLFDESSQIGSVLEEHNGLLYDDSANSYGEMEEDENDDMDSEELDQLMAGHRGLLSINGEQLPPGKALPAGIELGYRGYSTIPDPPLDPVDYGAAFDAVYNSPPQTKYVIRPPIQQYNIAHAIAEAEVFDNTFAVLVYNPSDDTFVGLYSRQHSWGASNKKLFVSMSHLAYLLRYLFPKRFKPDQSELAIPIGSGDYPHVKLSKLPYSGVAPVFEFGSVFRDPDMCSNMIPMAMPERHHLLCYELFVRSGTICDQVQAYSINNRGTGELVFGDEMGLEFDQLIVSTLPCYSLPSPSLKSTRI